MGAETEIGWTRHTGSPWLVCSKVSDGCVHCYAWRLAITRHGRIIRGAYKAAGLADWETRPVWGDTAPRVVAKNFWSLARQLNAQHAKAGTRGTMFPSLIDWLDDMPAGILTQDGKMVTRSEVLADFFQLIARTPYLDWLLLTKRPENWLARIDELFCFTGQDKEHFERYSEAHKLLEGWISEGAAQRVPANIHVGATVENQPMAQPRVEALLKIPARTHFLSCEPLVGPVQLLPEWIEPELQSFGQGVKLFPRVNWVIVGGESGHGARPMHPEWARSLRNQCVRAGVAFFFKQWGEYAPASFPDRLPDNLPSSAGFYFDAPHAPGKIWRFGKVAAGRVLDDRTWDEMPEALQS